MSYLGRGIFVEHVLRMEIVSYKIFGVDQPLQMEKTKLVIIGTLTSDEDHTLNILLENLPTSSSNTGQHNSQRKSVLSIPLEMKSPRWPCETIKKTSTEASENVPVTQDALTTQTGDATLVSKTHLTGTTSLELVHNEKEFNQVEREISPDHQHITEHDYDKQIDNISHTEPSAINTSMNMIMTNK